MLVLLISLLDLTLLSANKFFDNMVVAEKHNCLNFANQNPEISLPSSLKLDDNDIGVCTPSCSTSGNLKSRGTVGFDVKPEYTIKSRPCGLSHPLKIS